MLYFKDVVDSEVEVRYKVIELGSNGFCVDFLVYIWFFVVGRVRVGRVWFVWSEIVGVRFFRFIDVDDINVVIVRL